MAPLVPTRPGSEAVGSALHAVVSSTTTRRGDTPRRARRAVLLALLHVVATGCGIGSNPDPREIDGMMGYAALALERDDPAMLFRVIDERARHAMISIVEDRRAAAEVIRRDYPESQRAAALGALGDGAEAEDAAGLFAMRCDAACRQRFAGEVGAARDQREDGDEVVVTTARGAEVRVYRDVEGDWWGLVWNTAALDDERDRANRDLAVIEENAATYRRQRELEGE